MIDSKTVKRPALLLLHALLGSGLAQGAEIQPRFEVKNRFDVRIPMRDGVTLSADVWMPRQAGKYPVILMRTPYLKTMELLKFPELGHYFAKRGYVMVVQDVRGRGDSDGEFGHFVPDIADGYDTVEWLARQSWSNGRVGMMGVSYLGSVQWLAARARPPHLVCMVPTASAAPPVDVGFHGGAVLMGWSLPWNHGVSGRISQRPNLEGVDWDRVFWHRPLLTMDEALGRKMPFYRRTLESTDRTVSFKDIRFGPEVFQSIDIPALHVAGWFDGDQPSAVYLWKGMRAHSPANNKQYLLLGPWTHEQTFLGGRPELGDLQFSEDSVIDPRALHLKFFEHYLKGATEKFDFPRARIYVTGDNRWRDFEDYPPQQAREHKLYFGSGGRANTRFGDGRLNPQLPGHEPPDHFAFNPQDPVPSGFNGEDLPFDHRPIERRQDVLVYTTAVLEEPVEVIGNPLVTLYASSDARDTDFTAKILDVFSDGRAVKLGVLPASVVRARYRNSYYEEQLLTPNRVERYEIPLWDIAHTFLPGHRIRIEISSSAYPFVAPNPNTGNPIGTDTEWKVAQQRVYHDQQHPSHLSLPLMPRRSATH